MALIWLRTSGPHDGTHADLVGGRRLSGGDDVSVCPSSVSVYGRNWMTSFWNHGGVWETPDVVPLLNQL